MEKKRRASRKSVWLRHFDDVILITSLRWRHFKLDDHRVTANLNFNTAFFLYFSGRRCFLLLFFLTESRRLCPYQGYLTRLEEVWWLYFPEGFRVVLWWNVRSRVLPHERWKSGHRSDERCTDPSSPWKMAPKETKTNQSNEDNSKAHSQEKHLKKTGWSLDL